MKSIESNLKLEKLVFDKLEFIRKGFKNENEVAFTIEVQVASSKEAINKVTLKLFGDKKDEYTFTIEIAGFFSILNKEELSDDLVKDLINKNSVAILMPYVRSQVSLLTAQPDTECVILPPININKLMQVAEADTDK